MPKSDIAPPGALVHLLREVHPQPLFDERYLSALRRRDRDAENFLVMHFSRPVQSKMRARLRSPELIQDACQETFLRVIRYFGSGKTLANPARLPGFVHSVCHNVALEFLRAHTRHNQIPENTPEMEDSMPGPDSQFAAAERSKIVGRILCEMSEKDRQLLRRVCLDEEDRDQVCMDFQVDRNYLRVLLHRARNHFRAALTEGGRLRKFPAVSLATIRKMGNVTSHGSTNQQDEATDDFGSPLCSRLASHGAVSAERTYGG